MRAEPARHQAGGSPRVEDRLPEAVGGGRGRENLEPVLPRVARSREGDTHARHFPDIPVISEEDASEFGTPDAIGPRFFLVDPLDGTKAFVRGDTHFTVNIGLIADGRPVARTEHTAIYRPRGA